MVFGRLKKKKQPKSIGLASAQHQVKTFMTLVESITWQGRVSMPESWMRV